MGVADGYLFRWLLSGGIGSGCLGHGVVELRCSVFVRSMQLLTLISDGPEAFTADLPYSAWKSSDPDRIVVRILIWYGSDLVLSGCGQGCCTKSWVTFISEVLWSD